MYNLDLTKEEEKIAKDIYDSAIVIDGVVEYHTLENPELIQEYIDGGTTACNVTFAHCLENFYRGVQKVNIGKKLIEKNSDKLMLIKNVSDIEIAKKEKKLGVIIGFQDIWPIEDNVDYLDIYYDLGVRIIQLTYNSQNLVGTGCCELFYNGITYFGRKVIERMNHLGIAIDLSHCSDPTTMDAINLSKKPVYITHSSVRDICNSLRNKTREQIIALAEKGGVIGITFFPPLVKLNNDTLDVLPSTLEDVLDHIEYVIDLVGVDHVAFGSDICEKYFDIKKTPESSVYRTWRPIRPDVFGRGQTEFYDPPPKGLERHSQFLNLSRGLVKRGYKENDIKKILGGNIMRVLKEIMGE